MKSIEVKPVPENFFSQDYQRWLWVVASYELKFPWSAKTRLETDWRLKCALASGDLQCDDLEDLFTISYVTLNVEENKALIFFRRRDDVWCFEHMMYQTENRHSGLHAPDAHLEAAYEERYEAGEEGG